MYFLVIDTYYLLQVMVKRQRTAFPPNFVHSLDGSHMMMTAVACKRAGLNFAGSLCFSFSFFIGSFSSAKDVN